MDIRTLSFMTVLFAYLSAVGLYSFSAYQVGFRGMKTAAIGLFLTGSGFLLIFLRHHIPPEFSIILSNTLIPAGLLLANEGLCIFRAINSTGLKSGLALICLNTILFYHYTYIVPSLSLRIFCISILMAVLSGLCCWNLLRPFTQKTPLPRKLTALGIALFSCFMIFRALWAINENIAFDFMDAGLVHGLAFLVIILLFICITFGMAWMASALLQEELETFKRIISATPDIILLMDEYGIYRMANKAAVEYLGIEHGDIVGRNSKELLGEDFYINVTQPNLKNALRGNVNTTTMWLNFPHKGNRYIAIHYHPVPNEQGEIHFIAISCRDITEQQLIQEDRQRIFAMSIDMLCIMDTDGNLSEINPAWENSLGWTKKELIGTSWMDIVHPDDMKEAAGMVETLKVGASVFDITVRLKDKNGTFHFVSWTASPDPFGENVYAVARDVTKRMKLEIQLKEQATTDPLTGAGNRRLFMARTEEEIQRSQRYATPLSLLIFDIDFFKKINDTYGHDAGDDVLRALVVEVQNQLRTTDLLCRIGGEEFAVLLVNTDIDSAKTLAERIRRSLEQLAVASSGNVITFTASIGGAAFDQTADIESILKKADEALYFAKRNGRNQVKIA